MPTDSNAIILLSGGLDSSTVLAEARAAGRRCHALSFDYGQRHRVELEAAARVARSLGAVEHRTATIDLRAFGGSALTDDIPVPKDDLAPDDAARESAIPITYVPARNTIFLSFALAYAEVRAAREIWIGVNAIDYSGYPDCRPAFIEAFERLANLATKAGVEALERDPTDPAIRLVAPLVEMSKADIVRRAVELDVDLSLTHSCYDPDEHGRACGHCDSCLLRGEGFRAAGVVDPVLAS